MQDSVKIHNWAAVNFQAYFFYFIFLILELKEKNV